MTFADADDGAIVAAIEESARVEAAAGARRLVAIAELVARRVEPDGDERWYWACDRWDSAAAEVAAALNIGHRAASGLMHQALACATACLRWPPCTARGSLSSRVVSVLTWRTQLVEDAEALALIDAGLAQAGTRWGPLSATNSNRPLMHSSNATIPVRGGAPASPRAVGTSPSGTATT